VNTAAERVRLLLPGLWAGMLLCIALVATPAPFALLSSADAGRVVGRIFAQEGYASLVLGVLLLVLERMRARHLADAGQGSQFSAGMVLALTALFCTVLGYFALQPLMPAARMGQGPLSFGQLHAVSLAFFAAKILAVLALTWRAAQPRSA
jgi:Domain of unknown function (DUF4149)